MSDSDPSRPPRDVRLERTAVGLYPLVALLTILASGALYVVPRLDAAPALADRVARLEGAGAAAAIEAARTVQRLSSLETDRASDRASLDLMRAQLSHIDNLVSLICSRLPTRPGEQALSCR